MKHRILIFALILATAATGYAEYRILAFGDSNTWGWKPMGGGERFPDAVRWTGVLKAELGDEYTILTDGLVARRTNLDGMDTRLVTGSFLNGATTLSPSIIRNAPLDLVILFLGTNDLQLGAERSATEIAIAVEALVEQVGQSGGLLYSSYMAPSEVWVVAPAALGDLEGTPLESLFSVGFETSKELKSAFSELEGRTGIPTFYVDDICVDGIGADGIHLNEIGHRALGMALAKALKAAEIQ